MSEPSIESVLQKYFLKASKDDWKKIAMQETRGQDPFKVLAWQGKDEITFSPYYDATDLGKRRYRAKAPANEGTVSNNWANLPAIDVAGESTANAAALEHLARGADGVLFDLRKSTQMDVLALLRDIEWPFCTIMFNVNTRSGFESVLPDFFAQRKIDPALVTGALFWESIPKKNILQFFLDRCKGIRSMGFSIPPGAPSAEISTALLEGAKKLHEFGGAAADAVCFSIAVEASVPETIAKLKALRLLWRQVVRAYGHTDYNMDDLYIHAYSPAVPDADYAPHENMLKGTFAAIGAVIGGCNGLTIMTAENALLQRWARNVSLILRDESGFAQAASPFGGSYTLENMTDAIARQAWQLFQKKWSAYAEA